jgi:transposase
MQVVYERCCGLDVHKKVVVACLITPGPGGRPAKETRSFGTMTDELLRLMDWLSEAGCSHMAMESTGVYWKPVYNLLEGSFELMLVNAAHIKAVPGRKTDVKDAEWIAELLRHGLLKASFVPGKAERELRELTRYRASLVRERASEVNRLQKTLEGANIKLASVASNVMGVSGRQILASLLAGSTDGAAMAQLARGALRRKIPELERALVGCFGPHQRYMVAEQLAHIDYLDEVIERISLEVAQRLGPFDEVIQRLDGIPGISRHAAEVILAEIGTDMSRFPTADHLASWAGMSPGNDQSAGKRGNGKTTKGDPWLRTILVEAAEAAAKKSDSYLSAQFHRITRRRGKKKAAIAVGHSILVIAYHMLKKGTAYQDLGPDYYEQHNREAVERRLVHRLERLGYTVSPPPVAQAA